MKENLYILRKRKYVVFFGLVCLCIGVIFFVLNRRNLIVVGDNIVFVDVAVTDVEKIRGLSGKSSLCQYCGMFFVFDDIKERQFWMKDMYFDIDIIWIKEGVVVQVSENLDHFGGRDVRANSEIPVDHVLEVPAGFVARNQVSIGEKVWYFCGMFE